MTEKIKNAIDRIIDTRDYKYSHFSFVDDTGKAFDLAINSLKAWDEVLNELEEERAFEYSLGNDEVGVELDMCILIINQKLKEVEEWQKLNTI